MEFVDARSERKNGGGISGGGMAGREIGGERMYGRVSASRGRNDIYEVRKRPEDRTAVRVSLIKWFIGLTKYSNFCIQLAPRRRGRCLGKPGYTRRTGTPRAARCKAIRMNGRHKSAGSLATARGEEQARNVDAGWLVLQLPGHRSRARIPRLSFHPRYFPFRRSCYPLLADSPLVCPVFSGVAANLKPTPHARDATSACPTARIILIHRGPRSAQLLPCSCPASCSRSCLCVGGWPSTRCPARAAHLAS